MNAQEKAKAGLWMIEQAILQLLRERGPMSPVEVSDALGLSWQQPDGEQIGGIAYYPMRHLADTGALVKGAGVRPAYSVPPISN